MKRQVYIPSLMNWFDIVSENALWYGIIDSDGLNHIVYKPSAVVRST